MNHRIATLGFLLPLLFGVACLGGVSAAQSAIDLQALIVRMHDAGQEDYGQSCSVCHGSVYVEQTLVRKWQDDAGLLTTEVAKNHHLVHRDANVVDFGADCTFCHNRFEVKTQANTVLVSGYVDKLLCASCHSRFAPRSLMDLELQEISKDPPPGDESCTCACCHFAWPKVHTLIEVSDRFVQDLNVGTTADDCLACHGENPFMLPRALQDAYWQDRQSVGSEYATD